MHGCVAEAARRLPTFGSRWLQDGVRALCFSPLGTFLLTWQKLCEGAEAGNLQIWRISTGELACHFAQKLLGEKSAWPAVRWSDDEAVCCRMVTNEVHFFDGQAPTQTPQHKLRVERVAQFALAPGGGPCKVATFVSEHKGAPAVVRLWQFPDFGEGRFVASKTFFKASEVQLRWSPNGRGVLVQTFTEVDRTGECFFGFFGVFGECYVTPRSLLCHSRSLLCHSSLTPRSLSVTCPLCRQVVLRRERTPLHGSRRRGLQGCSLQGRARA